MGKSFKFYAFAAIAPCLLVVPNVAIAFSGNGSGITNDPYQITTCVQLQEMKDELDANYIQTQSLDCSDTTSWNSGQGFEPVGTSTAPFTGTLDGQGFEVTNLFIDRSADYVGLFGSIGSTAEIERLGLTDVNISGNIRTGALAGDLTGTVLTIDDVYVEGGSVNGTQYTGGLLGDGSATSVTIRDVYANVTVTGTDRVGGLMSTTGGSGFALTRAYAVGNVSGASMVGGLIGQAAQGSITLSYATGDVSGTDRVGGLIGDTTALTIANVYAVGDVTASSQRAGGLIGTTGFISSTASNVYAAGQVTTSSIKGGLLAQGTVMTFNKSFWDIETTGATTTAGSGTSTPKTTVEMKTLATFSDASWDIAATSTNRNNGYPFLSWEVGSDSPIWSLYDASLVATPDPEEEEDNNNRSRSGGRIHYGCKDQSATNYEYFSRHKQELCKYTTTTTVTPTNPGIGSCPVYTFTRNLRLGDSGEDVRALQQALNCLGFMLTSSGPGASGQETTLFRALTHAAVSRFQEAYASEILAPLNLTAGTGYFAEMSRTNMRSLMGEE